MLDRAERVPVKEAYAKHSDFANNEFQAGAKTLSQHQITRAIQDMFHPPAVVYRSAKHKEGEHKGKTEKMFFHLTISDTDLPGSDDDDFEDDEGANAAPPSPPPLAPARPGGAPGIDDEGLF